MIHFRIVHESCITGTKWKDNSVLCRLLKMWPLRFVFVRTITYCSIFCHSAILLLNEEWRRLLSTNKRPHTTYRHNHIHQQIGNLHFPHLFLPSIRQPSYINVFFSSVSSFRIFFFVKFLLNLPLLLSSSFFCFSIFSPSFAS